MTEPPHPRTREPIFNIPTVVLAGILALAGIHGARELLLGPMTDLEWLIDLAVIPARWTTALGIVSAEDVLQAAASSSSRQTKAALQALASYVIAERSAMPWTAVTYALLHGSWAHVLMNSIWLAAFGTPVARRCGTLRFSALAAATAIGGALAHALVYPLQVLPMIGASAVVSGMMAAAAWFMFAPAHWTIDGRLSEPHERLRESLASMLRNRKVILFLLVWFAVNYLSAILARPLGFTEASVAWDAHVGGFLAGLVLFPFLDPSQKRGGQIA